MRYRGGVRVPSRSFLAHPSSLPAVLREVVRGCTRAGLPPAGCQRVELVVEELFNNTTLHGYSRATPLHRRQVWIRIKRLGRRVVVHYHDAATPYDPLRISSTMVQRRLQRQQAGGLGCLLVASLPDRARYQHRDGRNTLALTFSARAGLV